MQHQPVSTPAAHSSHGKNMYWRLIIMLLASFVLMYILMYSMVDRGANVFPNLNEFYMAGLMSMPMLLLELLIMGKMYPNKKWNLVAMAVGLVLFIGFYVAIRQQSGVKDRQFIRSMIPHHAGAVLMVKQTNLSDPELKELAQRIIKSQEEEIAQMKRILARIQ